MKNYRELLKFLKGHEHLFGVAIIFMILASIFEGFQLPMTIPIVDRIFTDRPILLPNDNLPQFIIDVVDWLNNLDREVMFMIMPFAVMGLIVVKQAFMYVYKYFMNKISQRVMRDVRLKLFDKIINLSFDFFGKKRTGELISRITHDVNIIDNAVSYSLTDLFRQSSMIIIYIVFAFAIDPKSATILFIVFPLIGFPMAAIGKHLRKIAKSTQEKVADITSLLVEKFSGIVIVKAFTGEEKEVSKFKEENHGYYKLRMKSIKRLLLLPPITEILGTGFAMVIIVWLGRQVLDGQISFGALGVFVGSIVMIIKPVKKLGNVNALIQQALAASERIYEVLNTPNTITESDGAVDISGVKEGIKFENVSFQYESNDHMILDDISLDVKQGELVAVVGPTGTGKTTLVNLIPRFYDPQQGLVSIDGVNLKDIKVKSLRTQLGIVAQESILFNDSVKNNIAYGKPDATDAEIEDAAKKAFAHKFISKMPEGYETTIGDRGFRLSGGEKQRISIARAILKNPPILILDEATSQLDSESEKYVQEALDGLMKGRTVFAIAHRLSTITRADKIVVLNGGKIEGVGKHEKLLDECPLYKRLYEHQFGIA